MNTEVTLRKTQKGQAEYAVLMGGQLIGWICRCGSGIWLVIGMGEQLYPVTTATRQDAIEQLVVAACERPQQ